MKKILFLFSVVFIAALIMNLTAPTVAAPPDEPDPCEARHCWKDAEEVWWCMGGFDPEEYCDSRCCEPTPPPTGG